MRCGVLPCCCLGSSPTRRACSPLSHVLPLCRSRVRQYKLLTPAGAYVPTAMPGMADVAVKMKKVDADRMVEGMQLPDTVSGLHAGVWVVTLCLWFEPADSWSAASAVGCGRQCLLQAFDPNMLRSLVHVGCYTPLHKACVCEPCYAALLHRLAVPSSLPSWSMMDTVIMDASPCHHVSDTLV